MTSQIYLEVAGHPLELPDDFSLDVTEESPIFHDTGMHSDPVTVPTEGNGEVFGNVADPQSHVRPVGLEHLPARFGVSGLPFRSGTVAIQEDEELDGQFAFNIDESAQSFSDLIGDLRCQDIPLYNNERIPIGQKICNVSIGGSIDRHLYFALENNGDNNDIVVDDIVPYDTTFEPQALGFSFPGVSDGSKKTEKAYADGITVNVPNVSKSYINVSEAYESVGGIPAKNGWRYCNARVCYTHYKLDSAGRTDDVKDGSLTYVGTIGETSDEVADVTDFYGSNEDFGPYWVLDANRPQSGICFYVLYFLDCLFAHLGVSFDNSALMKIEDLRRLAFFTTHCRYMTDPTEAPVQTLGSVDAINKWAEDRGCGGRLEVKFNLEEQQIQQARAKVPGNGDEKIWHVGDMMTWYIPTIMGIVSGTDKIVRIDASGRCYIGGASAQVRTMYATSENFPEESVKTVLDSLEASFGIRFRYDYQRNKVTAYLLRDVLRQRDAEGNALQPITLNCEVLRVNKLAEKITGVRMKYSAESDGTEQMDNIRKAKRDYETDFDYIDYRQDRTKVGSGYMSIATDLRTENLTCYIDLLTGNAYRFKISKEIVEKSANVMYHRLFEVGQYHGIEVGDCSKRNESFVKELVSDFQPMSWNDVNFSAERKGDINSVLAAYIDEDMEHEFVTQKIAHPLYTEDVECYAHEVLRLVESYDPTQTDDGNSPLQSADWGLAIAIMRGGGTDMTTQNYSRNYDGFDNSKWRQVAGKYAMSSDTMDQFGYTFDYNGNIDGDGGGERFSLKIRSWKPFLYYIDASGKTVVTSDLSLDGKAVEGVEGKTWLRPCNADAAVMLRGLADVFMAELIWFLLNRRKLRIHCRMEAAAIMDIINHWERRFRIGDFTGFIDKVKYGVSKSAGIGEVEIDFFAI